MTDARVARLTPQQLACLRLLPTLHTYKAVARCLDLSPKTVENHVAAARATLGISDRFEAAAVVATFDAGRGQTPGGEHPIPQVPQIPPRAAHEDDRADRLHDVIGDFDLPIDALSRRTTGTQPWEGTDHDVHANLKTIGLICLLAVGILMLVIVTPPAARSWADLADTIKPHRTADQHHD